MSNTTQVKQFVDGDGDLDPKMNLWLNGHKRTIEVVDIKYSTVIRSSGIVSSALVIFRPLGEDE